MRRIIKLAICIGLLAVCGCATGNYTWTPTADDPNLVDLGPAPEQKSFGYNTEWIALRLMSCQTREEFDQEVREINAELEREYQQQQMIDAIKSLERETRLSRDSRYYYRGYGTDWWRYNQYNQPCTVSPSSGPIKLESWRYSRPESIFQPR